MHCCSARVILTVVLTGILMAFFCNPTKLHSHIVWPEWSLKFFIDTAGVAFGPQLKDTQQQCGALYGCSRRTWKTEVIAIISSKKNREMLRKRPRCKINPAYLLLVFSVHISYTWSTVYEKRTNWILAYYILGEQIE